MGEWTASFDTLVSAKLSDIMDSIAATGEALELDREIPLDRQEFLRRFVEAQMVSWEGQAAGLSQGWFFWTFKMEGSAFAEWDFLRGLSEGWIPSLPPTDVGSQDVYGACEEIIFRVNDTMSIVKEFPDPTTMDPNMVHDIPIDDDVVVSHGESLRDRHGKIVIDSNEVAHVVSPEVESGDYMSQSSIVMCLLLLVVILGIALKRHLFARSFVSSGGLKHQYEIIGDQA
jgi:glucan 1,3-beta-glucosidase